MYWGKKITIQPGKSIVGLRTIIKKKLWEDRSNSGKLVAEHFLLLEVKLFIIIIEQKCVRWLYSESWMYDRCVRNTVSFLCRSRCFCEHCVHVKCKTRYRTLPRWCHLFSSLFSLSTWEAVLRWPGPALMCFWKCTNSAYKSSTWKWKMQKQTTKKISTYIHLIDLHFKYYFQKQAPDLINIH